MGFSVMWGKGKKNPKEITIKLKKCLHETSFGDDYNMADQFMEENALSCSFVDLDLSACHWADPLPLLQFAIWLKKFDSRRVSFGQIILGSDLGGHAQFVSFVIQHGFLKEFSNIFGGRVLWHRGAGRDLKKYGDVVKEFPTREFRLKFSEPVGLAATIKSIRDLDVSEDNLTETVEGWVESVLGRTGHSKRTDDGHVFGLKLRIILWELVNNITKHAYPENEDGSFGVYIRSRTGKPQVMHCDRTTCRAQGPLGTAGSEFHDNDIWLEVVVCDLGLGIFHEMEQWNAPSLPSEIRKKISDAVDNYRNSKDFSNIVMPLLFGTPLSKHGDAGTRENKNLPALTGLQHVGQAMAEGVDGDFLRIFTAKYWSGRPFPWPEQYSGLNKHDTNLPGTVVVAYLRGKQLKDQDEDAWVSPRGEKTLSGLRKIYLGVVNSRTTNRYSLHIVSEKEMLPEMIAPDKQGLIYTPNPHITKNEFYRFVDKLIQLFKGRERGVVIVADLPYTSARLLSAVLPRTSRFPKGVRVYMVTNDLRVTAFDDESRYDLDNLEAKDLRRILASWFIGVGIEGAEEIHDQELLPKAKNALSLSPDLHQSLLATIANLRQHDSRALWDIIKQDVPAAFKSVVVDWTGGEEEITGESLEKSIKMQGYLDFNLMMSVTPCFSIVLKNLHRCSAIFPNCTIHPNDSLVRGLISGLEKLRQREASNASHLVVGSVLMTGDTTKRVLSKPERRDANILHVLHHPSGLGGAHPKQNYHCLFDWLPPGSTSHGPIEYKRISGTPFIAKGGDQTFELPRFKKPESNYFGRIELYEEECSYYGQRPSKAYEQWDLLGLMLTGHWKYGHHHDLIRIDLERAVTNDRYSGHPLRKWFEKTINEISNGNPSDWVLSYVAHPVAEVIIDDLRTSIHESFIPLRFIGLTASASIRIAPTAIEYLTDILASKKEGVILIDDGQVSGRTIREAREIIEEKTRRKVVTIAILDRTAYPITRRKMKDYSKENYRYWRWDVPSMGTERSCILCRAIESAWARHQGEGGMYMRQSGGVHDINMTPMSLLMQHSHNKVACADPVIRRLEEWKRYWEPKEMASNWSNGLEPSKLNRKHTLALSRDYSNPNSKIKIQEPVDHFTSTSLSAHLAEITRSTPRMDKPLEVVKKLLKASDKEKGNPEKVLDVRAAMEILCTQILLYWDNFDFKARADRYRYLATALFSSQRDDQLSSLAALCFELVDNQLADWLWPQIRRKVFRGENYGWSIDMTLAATSVFQRRSSVDFREDTRVANASEILAMKAFYGQAQVGNSTRDNLEKLFLYLGVANTTGHSSPLLNALSDASKVPEPPANLLTNIARWVLIVSDCLECLGGPLLPLPTMGRRGFGGEDDIAAAVEKLRTFSHSLDLTNPDRNKIINSLKYIFHDEAHLREKVLQGLSVGLEEIEALIKRELMPSHLLFENALKSHPAHKDKWGKRIPEFIVARLNSGETNSERSVYCDSLMRQTISDFFLNVMHSPKPITFAMAIEAIPFQYKGIKSLHSNDVKADLFCFILDSSELDGIELHLVNAFEGGPAHPKYKRHRRHFEEMGGVMSHDKVNDLFVVKIFLSEFSSAVEKRP